MKIFRGNEANYFIVPVPIGNLSDITQRAVDTLSTVDLIYCEDTRRARILLGHIKIKKPLISLHSHNERARVREVLSKLGRGIKIAYITDSGTPVISDPGASIIRAILNAGFSITALPGPTALIPAIVMSGLRSDKFLFLGFAPSTAKNRKKLLRKISDIKYTLIFYESPKRLLKFLNDALQILGCRRISVVREISKIHEETVSGTIEELIEHFNSIEILGEMTIVVEGTLSKSEAEPVD